MDRLRLSFFACLAGLIVAAGVGAQQPDTAPARRAFTLQEVRVHDAPDTTSRTVVVLPRATLVSVGDCDERWCGVAFRGITGFSARRYLAFSHRVADDHAVVTQQA